MPLLRLSTKPFRHKKREGLSLPFLRQANDELEFETNVAAGAEAIGIGTVDFAGGVVVTKI